MAEVRGYVRAVCLSSDKGVAKKEQDEGVLMAGHGLKGDAHAGPWHRQVSLLAQESVDKMIAKGLKLVPGDFGENLTTEGLDLPTLPIGTRLRVGDEALLEVTQIGKKCHHGCAIYQQVGDCIMPREGIFTRVLLGGKVKRGDAIVVEPGYRLAIVTASDKGARGERKDKSAQVIRSLTASLGPVVSYTVVPDDQNTISCELVRLADECAVDIVFTTGGTGLSPRDVTPEATLAVVDRLVPGFTEAMRAQGFEKTPHALLSRAVAGVRGQTLIINLPGSPRAVDENLAVILPALPHALEILTGRGAECGLAPQ
ncbi:MAG: molybdenum cofactor synthesis domain-containing protein [bacterium]